MVGCRLPAVGIGGVIATFTVFTTEGFVGVKSLGRVELSLAKKSANSASARTNKKLRSIPVKSMSVVHNLKR